MSPKKKESTNEQQMEKLTSITRSEVHVIEYSPHEENDLLHAKGYLGPRQGPYNNRANEIPRSVFELPSSSEMSTRRAEQYSTDAINWLKKPSSYCWRSDEAVDASLRNGRSPTGENMELEQENYKNIVVTVMVGIPNSNATYHIRKNRMDYVRKYGYTYCELNDENNKILLKHKRTANWHKFYFLQLLLFRHDLSNYFNVSHSTSTKPMLQSNMTPNWSLLKIPPLFRFDPLQSQFSPQQLEDEQLLNDSLSDTYTFLREHSGVVPFTPSLVLLLDSDSIILNMNWSLQHFWSQHMLSKDLLLQHVQESKFMPNNGVLIIKPTFWVFQFFEFVLHPFVLNMVRHLGVLRDNKAFEIYKQLNLDLWLLHAVERNTSQTPLLQSLEWTSNDDKHSHDIFVFHHAGGAWAKSGQPKYYLLECLMVKVQPQWFIDAIYGKEIDRKIVLKHCASRMDPYWFSRFDDPFVITY
ncbi:hypothetical protein RFI_19156 [Reticulomyxa filosa]|uniref:Uncharacterized protein n=1 Tax=Reticulomyxa filosa TaxID=46433 RepID=X6MVV8_RETFI|nr:hypothetical protein RFI_19156 [Reticulomyxa filosa]|eukprot:ETO18133.1 hypothetical protein RFI_19156 [Reticulomyxa filosa]